MKRLFPLCALLCATLPAFAFLDANNNGLSDLWERAYNNGALFGLSFDPQADADGDGWTNAQEAAAGTNPFDPNPPDGYLRPDIVHVPAVWSDTDFDEIPDTISTPEAFTITWTTIPGKQYTLLYSPDLIEWLALEPAFIGNGSVVVYGYDLTEDDKLFWRVKIEDVDSDGDELTDAEEAALGTDSHNAQTIPDIPDLWLATYFTNVLLAEGPNAIDPNSDPNNDGYTIVQEGYQNVDPNNPNNLNIGKEAIINGTFSDPAIGTNNGLNDVNADPGWDYWGEGGVTGWNAVFGHNIELQTITPETAGDQYVELKAHPEGHYGIQQQVATRKGMTYLFALRCRDRADSPPADSNFNILIDGVVKCKISFDDSIESDNLTRFISPGAWKTVPLLFSAEAPATWISLVPAISANDTTGCLVDKVMLHRWT